VGFWSLLLIGLGLILVGLFWPGIGVIAVSLAIGLYWHTWSHRTRERLTAEHARQPPGAPDRR
jgi:hypothetical protein